MADNSKQYMDVFQNLLDAGCDSDTVERFFQLQVSENTKEQLLLLYRQRRLLLDKVHEYQKSMDCLDYLIVRIKKSPSG